MSALRGQTWAFDDIPIGYTHAFGAAALRDEDIALFAAQFAPHLPLEGNAPPTDAPAAQAHVYAVWMRLLWEETKDWPVLGRLGQDALRWYRTAHGGDVLSVRMTFVSKQKVADDRGILITQHELMNQRGELVMTVMTRTLMART